MKKTHIPEIIVEPPGPKSKELHERAMKHMVGFSSQVSLFPVAFEDGRDCALRDVDGNTYLDFSAGIYVCGTGHCHPKVVGAIQRETAKLINCHDFTTPAKVRLLEKIAEIAPGDLHMAQLYCGGSECIETAIRLAKAYTKKFEFIGFHGSFHGKTMGAMSLADVATQFGPRIPGYYRAPYAYCFRCSFKMSYPECGLYCVDYLREVIRYQTTGNMAGIVLEPILGWGGSVVPPTEYLQKLRKLCNDEGILLIADEILTGCGRTGKMWCVEHSNVVPDIMTVGKHLGSGYPITAIVSSERIMKDAQFSASTSFGGNPVACAAAYASLQVIQEEHLVENAARIGEGMMKRLQEIKEGHRIVGDVRGRGLLLGIELVKDLKTKEPDREAGHSVYQKAFRRGLAWVPAHHILRIAPPMTITSELAQSGLDIIEEAIREVEQEM